MIKMAFTVIKIPKDPGKRQIMLYAVRSVFKDPDIGLGSDYYISSVTGRPMIASTADTNRINTIVSIIPKGASILEKDPRYEVYNSKNIDDIVYVKGIGHWYLKPGKNMMNFLIKYQLTVDDFTYCDKTTEFFRSSIKSLSTDIFRSKINPNRLFVNFKEGIRYQPILGMPTIEVMYDLKELSVSQVLLWTYVCIDEFVKENDMGYYDITELSRVEVIGQWIIFPYLGDRLVQMVKDFAQAKIRIRKRTIPDKEERINFHLCSCANRRSVMIDDEISWMLEDEPRPVGLFKYLGRNEEDPITLDKFENRMNVYYSPTDGNNYDTDSLESYFLSKPYKTFPMDRASCDRYDHIVYLQQMGVIKYHTKRGVINIENPYKPFVNDNFRITHTRDVLDLNEIDLNSEIYIKPSHIESADQQEELLLLNEVIIKAFSGRKGKVAEYISGITDEIPIIEAISNGFGGLLSWHYKTLGVFTQNFPKVDQEGANNDYIIGLIKRYANSDRWIK